jgi:hypothetical protein
MDGIQYALRRVHDGEQDAASQLATLAQRHRTDHEVHHVARDLAVWSLDHVAQVARAAERFGLQLAETVERPSGLLDDARAKLATAVGRRPEPALVLLEDMTKLYLRTAENSLAWEMLAQIAQARPENDLLELTKRCHPQTLRQVRWANTMLKTLSPQVLAAL